MPSKPKYKSGYLRLLFLSSIVVMCGSVRCLSVDTNSGDVIRVYSGYEENTSFNHLVGIENIRLGLFEVSTDGEMPGLVASNEWAHESGILKDEVVPRAKALQKKAEAGKTYRMVIELADDLGNIRSRAVSNSFIGTSDNSPLMLAFFVMQTDSFNLAPQLEKGVAVAPSMMSHARRGHAALKLENGKVMFVGGVANENNIEIAPRELDLFNPETNGYETLNVDSESWKEGRAYFAFCEIDSPFPYDSEEGVEQTFFLLAGGRTADGAFLNEVLLGQYIEGNKGVIIVPLGRLPVAVTHARAVKIPGTKSVLVTGGLTAEGLASNQAVLVNYDYETYNVVPLESTLYEPRYGHAMTVLPVAGEDDSQTWNVLVTGGVTVIENGETQIPSTISLVEVFSVTNQEFSCFTYDTQTESCLEDPCQKRCRSESENTFARRAKHAAIPLFPQIDGQPDPERLYQARAVLVGGVNQCESGVFPTYGNVEGYPSIDANGKITCQVFGAGKMPLYEVDWDILNADTHSVFVVGTGNGLTDSTERSAQIYRFSYSEGDESCQGVWDLKPIQVRAVASESNGGVRANSPFGTASMQVAREDFTVTALDNGNVLVAGGADIRNYGFPLNTVEVYMPPIGNQYGGFFDFCSSFETEDIGPVECVENCGPPVPSIVVDDVYASPQPLSEFKMSGLQSFSPYGEIREPLTYQWSWSPGGRPASATDAVLVCDIQNNDYDSENDITSGGDDFTDCGETKIFFPTAGTYKFRLKVKDSAGMVSGPSEDCPQCEEYATREVVVRPSKKLYVELVWDKGGDGLRGVDMDLYLVRKRDEGTFAVSQAKDDRIQSDSWRSLSCSDDSDCTGGFHCDQNMNFCDKICTNDRQCFDYAYGYFCSDDKCALYFDRPPTGDEPYPPLSIYCGICTDDENNYCGDDSDCGDGATCQPSQELCAIKDGYCRSWQDSQGGSPKYVCAEHTEDVINDTCFFQNHQPDWGVKNEEDDDPSLDIDDVDGWGPEVISLENPASGTYRVVVRLFSDPLMDVSPESPVTAYVKILINANAKIYFDPATGQFTDEAIKLKFTKTLTYWKVADIVWDAEKQVEGLDLLGDGEIEVLSTTPETAEVPVPDLTVEHYANPFWAVSGPFDPLDCVNPRSIWCDKITDVISSDGKTCQQVYSNIPPWCE